MLRIFVHYESTWKLILIRRELSDAFCQNDLFIHEVLDFVYNWFLMFDRTVGSQEERNALAI